MEEIQFYDYTLETAEERIAHAEKVLEQKDSDFVCERLADYILYGKTEENGDISVFEHGDIIAPSKERRRRKHASLDVLGENLGFNESSTNSAFSRVYSNKRKDPINDEDRKDPDIAALQPSIDRLQALYNNYKATEKDPEIPELTSLEARTIRDWLIDLRSSQHVIKAERKPVIQQKPTFFSATVDVETEIEFQAFPLGTLKDNPAFQNRENWYCSEKPETLLLKDGVKIDLTDFKTIISILSVANTVVCDENSAACDLVDTIMYYVDRADLKPEYRIVLEGRMNGISNTEINSQIEENGLPPYSVTWISAIWRQKIPELIVAEVTRHIEEYNAAGEPDKWKQCNLCGKWLPKSTSFYSIEKRRPDGFANRCKSCLAGAGVK